MSFAHGDLTVAKLLGEKWPRILPETLAACYVKLTLKQFREIREYQALVRAYPGVERGIDRNDLDTVIEIYKSTHDESGGYNAPELRKQQEKAR